MTDHLRPLFTSNSFSRRRLLTNSAAIAGGIGASSLIGLTGARAATLKTVRFSEAVHNLGYINLYVGMHAGIFKKNGLDMKVSAAGGDTQTFAAVLGGSADFAIGDATMAQISRENGGPGVVVGTVVQRAHYFGVSKTLQPITDPKGFKGLKIVTSPEPNTNYSVAKRLLEKAGLKVGVDATIVPKSPPCWPVRRISPSPISRAWPRPRPRAPRWCSISQATSARSATLASWCCPRRSRRIRRWCRHW
jgi:NitT/TauT family transport system substrate-binding protein